ncbi:MAG: hypothetical protein Q4F41_19285 [Eubacteriales bacterium]|nr:hypothetical protein [Eubacteriales bacterium]
MSENFFIVKILENENGRTEGILEEYDREGAIPFRGLDDALLAINSRIEPGEDPESCKSLRTFREPLWKETAASRTQPAMTGKIREMFYIQVLRRRNSSMQGILMWNGHGGESFRSGLELLSLMRSALG